MQTMNKNKDCLEPATNITKASVYSNPPLCDKVASDKIIVVGNGLDKPSSNPW